MCVYQFRHLGPREKTAVYNVPPAFPAHSLSRAAQFKEKE